MPAIIRGGTQSPFVHGSDHAAHDFKVAGFERVTIGAGAVLDEVRAMIQTTLADHEERVQVDLRRRLND
ncbi:MAG: hypothetical protein COB39_09030 [Marinosulfonomonas sp.]|nr:MAG: hypothetical protein COB39_09030 [Marinosulfonomonas sp.]